MNHWSDVVYTLRFTAGAYRCSGRYIERCPFMNYIFQTYQDVIKKADPEIADTIKLELDRQTYGLELIASENITSPAVLAVQGSVLANKYAEGYPSRRFYGGCKYVDTAEELAIDRAKKLFGAPYANVQPLSLIHISEPTRPY